MTTVTVPVEPTEEMILAALSAPCYGVGHPETGGLSIRDQWKAMLAAAPTATPGDDSTDSDVIAARKEFERHLRSHCDTFGSEFHYETTGRMSASPASVNGKFIAIRELVRAYVFASNKAAIAQARECDKRHAQGQDADGARWRWCLMHDAFPLFDDANGRQPWSCAPMVSSRNGGVHYGDTAAEAVSNAMAAQEQRNG